MSTMSEIFDAYATLCNYCDSVFDSIHRLYTNKMQCRKGCNSCCELSSVCAIEAHAIASCFYDSPVPLASRDHNGSSCALLTPKGCAAYAARPVICRTHGALLLAEGDSSVLSSCNLNFATTVLSSFPRNHVINSPVITANLMRLNMAFCITVGNASLSSTRFSTAQVLRREIPSCILTAQA